MQIINFIFSFYLVYLFKLRVFYKYPKNNIYLSISLWLFKI